jgi:hypothetical protein
VQALYNNANAVAGAFGTFASSYAKTFVSCVDTFTEDYAYYLPRYQEQLLELKLDASWYRDLTDDDIGKAVTDSVNNGELVGYDNENETILVTPDDPQTDKFDTANSITTGGEAPWTMSEPASVVVPAGAGPNLQALISCRHRFAQYRLAAETDVDNANAGVSKANSVKTDVDTQVSDKEADVTAARTAVTTAQVNYSKAQADLQTAYDSLESAYNAVKAVCPSWSPNNPFPPLP